MNQPDPSEEKGNAAFWAAMLFGLLGLAASFAFFGKSVTEKMLTDLFMPMGMLWMTLTVLCVVLWKRKLYMPLLISAFAWGLCFVGGNGLIAGWMMQSMEDEYYEVDPLSVAPFDTVVLLGGGTSDAPNGQVQINENGDRVVLAARMFHRGLAKRIVCTGARIKGLSSLKRDEADAGRILLTDLGVDEDAIMTFGGRNTSEEMQQIAGKLGSEQEIGIITSAWHMPRAMRLAEGAGINAQPLPANYASRKSDVSEPVPVGKLIRGCIPNLSALGTNSRVLREHLARLVNR